MKRASVRFWRFTTVSEITLHWFQMADQSKTCTATPPHRRPNSDSSHSRAFHRGRLTSLPLKVASASPLQPRRAKTKRTPPPPPRYNHITGCCLVLPLASHDSCCNPPLTLGSPGRAAEALRSAVDVAS